MQTLRKRYIVIPKHIILVSNEKINLQMYAKQKLMKQKTEFTKETQKNFSLS